MIGCCHRNDCALVSFSAGGTKSQPQQESQAKSTLSSITIHMTKNRRRKKEKKKKKKEEEAREVPKELDNDANDTSELNYFTNKVPISKYTYYNLYI